MTEDKVMEHEKKNEQMKGRLRQSTDGWRKQNEG